MTFIANTDHIKTYSTNHKFEGILRPYSAYTF